MDWSLDFGREAGRVLDFRVLVSFTNWKEFQFLPLPFTVNDMIELSYIINWPTYYTLIINPSFVCFSPLHYYHTAAGYGLESVCFFGEGGKGRFVHPKSLTGNVKVRYVDYETNEAWKVDESNSPPPAPKKPSTHRDLFPHRPARKRTQDRDGRGQSTCVERTKQDGCCECGAVVGEEKPFWNDTEYTAYQDCVKCMAGGVGNRRWRTGRNSLIANLHLFIPLFSQRVEKTGGFGEGRKDL